MKVKAESNHKNVMYITLDEAELNQVIRKGLIAHGKVEWYLDEMFHTPAEEFEIANIIFGDDGECDIQLASMDSGILPDSESDLSLQE